MLLTGVCLGTFIARGVSGSVKSWMASPLLKSWTLGRILGIWGSGGPWISGIFRDPQEWDPLPILFPYHSHKIWEWYGKLTIRGSQYWESLKSPLTGGSSILISYSWLLRTPLVEMIAVPFSHFGRLRFLHFTRPGVFPTI